MLFRKYNTLIFFNKVSNIHDKYEMGEMKSILIRMVVYVTISYMSSSIIYMFPTFLS